MKDHIVGATNYIGSGWENRKWVCQCRTSGSQWKTDLNNLPAVRANKSDKFANLRGVGDLYAGWERSPHPPIYTGNNPQQGKHHPLVHKHHLE